MQRLKWSMLFMIVWGVLSCGGGGSAPQGSQLSDVERVAAAKADLTFETIRNQNQIPSYITYHLYLPPGGLEGTALSWASSDPSVVAIDGSVTRPSAAQGNADVTLTATLARGTVSDAKRFVVTVIAQPLTDAEAVGAARTQLTFDLIKGANLAQHEILSDLHLITSSINATTVSWTSSRAEIVAADGSVTRPLFSEGNADIILTATISRNAATDSKQFILTVVAQISPDVQAVELAKAALTFEVIRGLNVLPEHVAYNLNLAADGVEGTSILWNSSDPAIVAADGSINRPDFSSGNATVILTATISRNGASDTKPFNLTVLAQPSTDAQAVATAKAALTFDVIRGLNAAQSQIVDNLALMSNWIDNTAVTWSSSDLSLVSAAGNVTRPLNGSGNRAVTLTAAIQRGAALDSKLFSLTVLELPNANEFDYPGFGYAIHHVETPQTDSTDAQIQYSLYLDEAVKDVYFIFTNISSSDTADPPVVADRSESSLASELALAAAQAEAMAVWARQNGVGLSGRPDITLFNSNPARYGQITDDGPLQLNGSLIGEPAAVLSAAALNDLPGNQATFFPQNDTSTSISATCRSVVEADGKILNVWVADDSWGETASDCTRAYCVNQRMVDHLADKFLLAGPGNDIYAWVSNIFGAEYGPHSYPSLLIPPDDNITILLFDIDGDNSTNGGILGYFWTKDNYLQTSLPGSNQRVMFYIDAVMYATPEGPTWDSQDFWPQEMINTLAHEFQHMIHYYQKLIVYDAPNPETWLNEMASMVAEDFVATRLQSDGPRGVSYLDGSSGPAGNTRGWLPRFDRFDYLPLSQWMAGFGGSGDENVLNSYALAYAFGAYLARNYDGAEFFQDLVQNDKADQQAIDEALISGGYTDDDFATVLRKWGAALLLSDDPGVEVPEGYRLNSGDFFETSLNGMTYELGSINLFNYTYLSQTGPRIYTSLPPTDTMAGKYKTSNLYYKLGSNLTGTITQDITLKKGSKLTVVVK